jgi:hypothetical protein
MEDGLVMSLLPVSSEHPGGALTCSNCAAALVPDQRYCLACGQPCSPVRLAFLDVLQAERQPASRPVVIDSAASGHYASTQEQSGAFAWLGRYSGLIGLLSVLSTSVLIGLLVGHWITQSRTPVQQVLKVEGLSGAPLAPATMGASTVPNTAASTAANTAVTPTRSSKAAEAKAEAQEAKTSPPPPAPVKVNTQALNKLSTTKGKRHQQEIAKLTEGGKPIETGGGGGSSPTPAKESGKPAGGGSAVTTIE